MNIVVSCGDVNGIGLEAFFKALPLFEETDDREGTRITLAVNKSCLLQYADTVPGENLNFQGDTSIGIGKTEIRILPCDTECKVMPGNQDIVAGKLAIESLDKASGSVLEGQFDALVTLPIAKDVMSAAGWGFIGHTQYIAHKCGLYQALMILFKDDLRVAVVTDHIPLMNVGEYLAMADLPLTTAEIFNKSLVEDFAVENPKIAVLSLNPHAGENGKIGKEEVDLLDRQIKMMNVRKILAEGPMPADGFFGFGSYKNYDGILAMYHDQGLIPLKLLAGGGGVNFTAGLPIVRTSPDHGTAFSIAGRDEANPQSTLEALQWAVRIAKNRSKSGH